MLFPHRQLKFPSWLAPKLKSTAPGNIPEMLPASYNPGIELYRPPRPARFVLGETRKERAALRPTAAVCKA